MSFFDDSHVTDVGLTGSLGPSVSFFDMVAQGFEQQFRVDSARALDDELRNRWLESLKATNTPRSDATDPFDPYAYRAFAQYISGQQVDTFDANRPIFGEYNPTDRIKGMIEANEAIKKLNDPNIKSFEQIFEEVSQLQRETESETLSMSERGGSIVGELLGAIGGSFTTRDPLNLITAPLGAGRTVATRIASEMGLAAAITGATELGEVAPAREIVGLPERSALINIAAATVGAGIIRGGIEGIGAGVRALPSTQRAAALRELESMQFDARDTQMRAMFETLPQSPSARAGAQALDDIAFVERNNPYGEGQAANVRFLAELQDVQRVMGGAPMTAVARVLPPVPFEYIEKAADFARVKEQSPLLYARMEQAQARVAEVEQPRELIVATPKVVGKNELRAASDQGDGVDLQVAGDFLRNEADTALQRGDTVTLYSDGKAVSITQPGMKDAKGQTWGAIGILTDKEGGGGNYLEITSGSSARAKAPDINEARRAANAEYETAYRAVEAEAAALRAKQEAEIAAQQSQAVSLFTDATSGRPFSWSQLQHEYVGDYVDAINLANDTLDERAVAMFAREVVGEGEEAVEREAWLRPEGVDIGLKKPVDPEFRFSTDEGDLSIADAMRDLQDDADLDDAIRTCLL